MIHSVMIFNRQGRTRLEKWYTATSQKQKSKVVRNLTEMIPRRPSRFSNIIEMSDIKVVYKDTGSKIFDQPFLDHLKGSPDQSHLIFEINVGNRRIRHKMTKKLSNELPDRLKID